jgi:hypothetical protein
LSYRIAEVKDAPSNGSKEYFVANDRVSAHSARLDVKATGSPDESSRPFSATAIRKGKAFIQLSLSHGNEKDSPNNTN